MAAWNELPPTGGWPECDALVALAERLRWSAPELVMHYTRKALAVGGGSGGPVMVRAQALLAAALVRLGRHADAVEPGLAALRGADQSGVPEFASSVRIDLAACARGLGEPMLGCAILRPVLDAVGSRPATRAGAIGQLVGCTAHVGRRDDIEDLLAEADRLFSADDGLSADTRRLERALLAVCTAAYHRRYGETEDAVDAAREGLGLLARLRDQRLEGGRAWARLTWELVCALLDDGELADAEQEAGVVLGQPVRAASAPAAGQLMLAVATRILVPGGRVGPGRGLLEQATRVAERHDLDWLLADALTATADLDERATQPADALRALRSAHAAENRHRRVTAAAARALVTEFGVGNQSRDAVNSLLRNMIRAPVTAAPPVRAGAAPGPPTPAPAPLPAARPAAEPPTRSEPPPAETDEATGLLTREGLSRRLAATRGEDRPVALTLVRLDPVDAEHHPPDECDNTASGAEPAECPPDALTTIAGRVRDIAPEDAELARSDGSELAVLLPHTTRDEAEEFAATIRESAIESHWLTETSGVEVSISTGVAQSDPDPATGQDADSLLTAARETLTPADRDRTEPVPPVDQPGPEARTQAIRELLAPLLDHPSLTGRSQPVRFTIPTVPDPDDVPQPAREPDPVPPIPPGPEPAPEVPPPDQLPPPETPTPAGTHPDRVLDDDSSWLPKPDPVAGGASSDVDSDPPASGSDADRGSTWAAGSDRVAGAESGSAVGGGLTWGSRSDRLALDAASTWMPEGSGVSSAEGAEQGRDPDADSSWLPKPDPPPPRAGWEHDSEPDRDRGPTWIPKPDLASEPSREDEPEPGSGRSPGDAESERHDHGPGAGWDRQPPVESGPDRAWEPSGAGPEQERDRERESSEPKWPGEAMSGRGAEPVLGRESRRAGMGAAEREAGAAPVWESAAPREAGPAAVGESAASPGVEPAPVWESAVPREAGAAPVRESASPREAGPAPVGESAASREAGAGPVGESAESREAEPAAVGELDAPREAEPAWPPAQAVAAEQEAASAGGGEAALGPVQGPQPRPPDPPGSRTGRRRDRSETTSIAELLAEALAAYQSTAPEDEPTQPRVEPVRENTPPGQRTQPSSGRHRMPDWTTSDRNEPDWMTFDRDSR